MNLIIKDQQIRAVYTDTTIRIYQAYPLHIAIKAVEAQTLVSPFKMDRMTWIKPSFFWMMYRSGWAMKPGQEHVLAIDISREGFEWALEHASLSHYIEDVHESHDSWLAQKEESPVRIQWDPERDANLERLEYRSIQIGLSGDAVKRYTQSWIQGVTDLTPWVAKYRDHPELMPRLEEREYPLPEKIKKRIGVS